MRYPLLQLHYEHESASRPAYARLYGQREGGELVLLASEEFGPFDTALDVARWLTRQLRDSARLQLR